MSVFRELIDLGWADEQGVPTPLDDAFVRELLPHIRRAIGGRDLSTLARALRDFLDEHTSKRVGR